MNANVSRRGAGLVLVLVLSASAAPAAAETIRGSVQTADGRPARGARVWTASVGLGLLDRKETVADDFGRFALAVEPGHWVVWANLGTQGGEKPDGVAIEAGHEAEPIAITLAEWGRLRGRLVAAESGEPISGGKFALDHGLVPTADDQGRFEAVGLSHDDYHEAFVIAPGRARMRVLFVMSDRPVTELEVRVPRAGKIVGRVSDERGQPIPGAYVGHMTSGHTISCTALFDRCDDLGRFEYDGVAFDQPTWLNAHAPDYEVQQKDDLLLDPKTGSLSLDFRFAREPEAPGPEEAAKAQAVTKEARVAPKFRAVTGTVRGPGAGPIAGAVVRWGPEQDAQTVSTRTGADGRFRLAHVPDQEALVAVFAVGFWSSLAPAFPLVQGHGDQDLQVSLVAGRSAQGVVRDDLGQPLEGVSVIPQIPSPDPNWGPMVWLEELGAKTDREGRFELFGLPASGVTFDFLGERRSQLRNHVLELDGADNTVTMPAAGAIRGRVVDPDGRPVRNFRILLSGARPSLPDDKSGGYFAGLCGTGLTYTSDDGTFVVKELMAESFVCLSVLAPGYGEGVAGRVQAISVNHLPPAEALTIRLTKAHALRVRTVEAHTGRPVADARVVLIYNEPSLDTAFWWGYHDATWRDTVHTRTDRAGWAEFPTLAYSQATLLVQAPGYGRRHLGWRDRAPEVTVALKPEAVVTGELVDKTSGKPLAGINLGLTSTAAEEFATAIKLPDLGRFRLAELPEGDYTLTVSTGSGGTLHEERLVLEAGQTRTLSLRLSKSETKEGVKPPQP